jgi:ribosomal protein S12 methylthiotransferase
MHRLRDEVPGIHLRTTLLLGHPGETEDDVEQLKQFIRDIRFERLGAFAYSDEEGTYSNKTYSDDIPFDVKQQRVDEIMSIQEGIAAELNEQKVGRTLRVMIDRQEGEYFIGRTEYDSPEVDGEVLIPIESNPSLEIGVLYPITITRADTFDLYGDFKV